MQYKQWPTKDVNNNSFIVQFWIEISSQFSKDIAHQMSILSITFTRKPSSPREILSNECKNKQDTEEIANTKL